MNIRPVSQWRDDVKEVLLSKQKEFEMLGYKEITVDEIWRCLAETVWKKDKKRHLYEVVQAIFQLQIHTYMDFLTIDSLQSKTIETDDELMASINAVMQRNNE